jgi:metabotropic X receptor
MEGDLILGGLMMIHERQDDITCGPVMPQGGIQVNLESNYLDRN